MSYVGDSYTHDVFFSYAHGDEELHGWSLEVAELIVSTLRTALGDRERKLSLYVDPQLGGNEHLRPQLRAAVDAAATQVVIMTGYYPQSDWCRQEVSWFRDAVQRQDAQNADNKEKRPGRVFVVRAQNVASSLWPQELRDGNEALLGYRCCDEVPDRAEAPWTRPWGYLDRTEKLRQAIGGLCDELALALYEIRRQDAKRRAQSQRLEERQNAGAAGPRRSRVFLGFVTEDLEFDRGKLRDRLATDPSLEVVAPERPADVDDIRAEAAEQAADCDALVQLCGRAAGSWQRDGDGFLLTQIRQFEAQRRPIWLVAVPWLRLAEMPPTSAYANLLRAREEAGKLAREAPACASVIQEIEAARRRQQPQDAAEAEPGDLPECVLFIPSRKEYQEVETNIRNALQKQRKVSASVVPLTPVWNLRDPRDLKEVAALRQKRAAEIDGEFLILAGFPTLEEDDFFELRRLRRQAAALARPPVAIVDGTTGLLAPGFPPDFRILKIGTPDFETGLAAWLQACATRRKAEPAP